MVEESMNTKSLDLIPYGLPALAAAFALSAIDAYSRPQRKRLPKLTFRDIAGGNWTCGNTTPGIVRMTCEKKASDKSRFLALIERAQNQISQNAGIANTRHDPGHKDFKKMEDRRKEAERLVSQARRDLKKAEDDLNSVDLTLIFEIRIADVLARGGTVNDWFEPYVESNDVEDEVEEYDPQTHDPEPGEKEAVQPAVESPVAQLFPTLAELKPYPFFPQEAAEVIVAGVPATEKGDAKK